MFLRDYHGASSKTNRFVINNNSPFGYWSRFCVKHNKCACDGICNIDSL